MSKSGEQLQIILCEDLPAGTMLSTSKTYALNCIHNNVKAPFTVLSLMPFMVGANRFPQSKVYDTETGEEISFEEAVEQGLFSGHVDVSGDALSDKSRKKQEKKKMFSDPEDFSW